MLATVTPELPWQQVGGDTFHFEGQDLAVVYYSQFPEVPTLHGTKHIGNYCFEEHYGSIRSAQGSSE